MKLLTQAQFLMALAEGKKLRKQTWPTNYISLTDDGIRDKDGIPFGFGSYIQEEWLIREDPVETEEVFQWAWFSDIGDWVMHSVLLSEAEVGERLLADEVMKIGAGIPVPKRKK